MRHQCSPYSCELGQDQDTVLCCNYLGLLLGNQMLMISLLVYRLLNLLILSIHPGMCDKDRTSVLSRVLLLLLDCMVLRFHLVMKSKEVLLHHCLVLLYNQMGKLPILTIRHLG